MFTKLVREDTSDDAELWRTDAGFSDVSKTTQRVALGNDTEYEFHDIALSGCRNDVQLRFMASGPMRLYVDAVDFKYESQPRGTCPTATTYWCESSTCPPTTSWPSPTCRTYTVTHHATLVARVPTTTCVDQTTTTYVPATIDTSNPGSPTPSASDTTAAVNVPSLSTLGALLTLTLVMLLVALRRE